MSRGTRELKRRIKSIGNTKKITKAMEMVAAAKMRRAVSNVIATRDYANLAWVTVLSLAEKTDKNLHPLLQKRDGKNIALVVISSNRGLCGAFNHNIVKKALASIKKHEGSVESTEILTMGTKARDILLSEGKKVAADFIKQDLILSAAEVTSLAHLLISGFKEKKYDKVMVAYTDFVSSIKQVPRVKQLLPLEADPDGYLGVVGKSEQVTMKKEFIDEKKDRYSQKGDYKFEYLFEPDAEIVLEQMLPRLIEVQLYQAVLESDASEHSSRMLSMRNATDAARDMINSLTLIFNQARQAAITQEIAEISSGKAALEK